MAEMDLVPAEYRYSLQIRRWLRNFALIYAVVIASVVATKLTLSRGIEEERSAIEALRAQKQVTLNQLARIQDLQARKVEADRRLDLLAGLRGGPAAQRMFLAIDRALSSDVWFTSWNFRRAGQVVDAGPKTVETGYFIVVPRDETQKEEKTWQMQTHMEVRGQALTHSALAGFVERLLAQREIEDVRILRTTLRRYTATQVVDYELAVVVDSRPERS